MGHSSPAALAKALISLSGLPSTTPYFCKSSVRQRCCLAITVKALGNGKLSRKEPSFLHVFIIPSPLNCWWECTLQRPTPQNTGQFSSLGALSSCLWERTSRGPPRQMMGSLPDKQGICPVLKMERLQHKALPAHQYHASLFSAPVLRHRAETSSSRTWDVP